MFKGGNVKMKKLLTASLVVLGMVLGAKVVYAGSDILNGAEIKRTPLGVVIQKDEMKFLLHSETDLENLKTEDLPPSIIEALEQTLRQSERKVKDKKILSFKTLSEGGLDLTTVGSTPLPYGNTYRLDIDGNYAYVLNWNGSLFTTGLYVMDISNPTDPMWTGGFISVPVSNWNGASWDIDVANGYAYIASYDK